VLADDTSDPELIAADLLAQAEHDPDARAILIATDRAMIAAVNHALVEQLTSLPTALVAGDALRQSFAILVDDIDAAIDASDRIAPEHLAIHTSNADVVAARTRHYGGLFVGSASAEVLADYAAGPNHTLPTGQAARYTGGLSVLDFLRVRTYVRIDDRDAAEPLIHDAEQLARLEGLEGHARSASVRRREGDA
jgi:phosphoribosyl-ATP pyrophosphohydrolase/phosphoribosyl-AMP cyclohydrolase/histidinol dehydrogenase